MRIAIERAARTSSMIRHCLELARPRQLAREDIYVLLAYEALVRLEDLHQEHEQVKAGQVAQQTFTFEFDGHFWELGPEDQLMIRTMLQAKLHRVLVTRADLHYEGSCGIDDLLLQASGIKAFQYIEVYNINSGERFSTYALRATGGSGEICLNGAAARKAVVGDLLIIAAYSSYTEDELQHWRPTIVSVDERNRVRSRAEIAVP
jgi:aspartate 1-decarboxylase